MPSSTICFPSPEIAGPTLSCMRQHSDSSSKQLSRRLHHENFKAREPIPVRDLCRKVADDRPSWLRPGCRYRQSGRFCDAIFYHLLSKFLEVAGQTLSCMRQHSPKQLSRGLRCGSSKSEDANLDEGSSVQRKSKNFVRSTAKGRNTKEYEVSSREGE